MRVFKFELVGQTPLLMHADNIPFADYLGEWRTANLKGTPGDDRSPNWTWTTYVHTDGVHLVWPAAAVMKMLEFVGKTIKLKGNKTFADMTQYGMAIRSDDGNLPLLIGDKPVLVDPILRIREESCKSVTGIPEFAAHKEMVFKRTGINLDVRRVINPATKKRNIRVRPVFHDWKITGILDVSSPELTDKIIQRLFADGGFISGMGDNRPARRGQNGRFKATVTLVESSDEPVEEKKPAAKRKSKSDALAEAVAAAE